MLSAARYPVVLYGPIHLPPILPVDAALYSVLRRAHTALAYLLFFTVMQGSLERPPRLQRRWHRA